MKLTDAVEKLFRRAGAGEPINVEEAIEASIDRLDRYAVKHHPENYKLRTLFELEQEVVAEAADGPGWLACCLASVADIAGEDGGPWADAKAEAYAEAAALFALARQKMAEAEMLGEYP